MSGNKYNDKHKRHLVLVAARGGVRGHSGPGGADGGEGGGGREGGGRWRGCLDGGRGVGRGGGGGGTVCRKHTRRRFRIWEIGDM